MDSLTEISTGFSSHVWVPEIRRVSISPATSRTTNPKPCSSFQPGPQIFEDSFLVRNQKEFHLVIFFGDIYGILLLARHLSMMYLFMISHGDPANNEPFKKVFGLSHSAPKIPRPSSLIFSIQRCGPWEANMASMNIAYKWSCYELLICFSMGKCGKFNNGTGME